MERPNSTFGVELSMLQIALSINCNGNKRLLEGCIINKKCI